MKKHRLLAIAAFLVAPSILVSSPGLSTSRLPGIDESRPALGQQSCPIDRPFGCFNPAFARGDSATTASSGPFATCRQFMQMFLRWAPHGQYPQT